MAHQGLDEHDIILLAVLEDEINGEGAALDAAAIILFSFVSLR